ncbi:hypothetical protein BMETH_907_0 [methanotrophic bacterial endosymbiont of Bathymodiolus sp.]|nr:hypothetical protein BMETH_907_0 [methanotrophic bacterial endosymbiont of Bathymodiolus sp.]
MIPLIFNYRVNIFTNSHLYRSPYSQQSHLQDLIQLCWQ